VPLAESTRGRLLVATPPLGDPNFDRTVLFMLEHTHSGAVGVVLNRIVHDIDDGDAALDLAALTSWRLALAPPRQLFEGGPVGDDSLIGLARGTGRNEDGWGAVTNTIGTVDLSMDPDEVDEDLRAIRIFRGYAGWAPSQLDAEIAAGAWMVFDAEEADLFTEQPDELWRTVVRRQGGRLAWIADAPDDLAAN
jgi:putative transcriptional regulator